VRVFIGLAVAHEQHARKFRAGAEPQCLLQERVEGDIGPQSGVVGIQCAQQRRRGVRTGRYALVPSIVHGHAAAIRVDDPPEHVPRAVRLHLARERLLTVQPLEYRRVGVGTVAVTVDARIEEAGERFAVARIGEPEAVHDLRHAATGTVTEQLPLLRHRAPEKRQQGLASSLRRVAPEIASQ
jgi:hypothetical protein